MTRKERVRRALCREAVDRLPTQTNYTPRMGEKLAAYFGVRSCELPMLLDNHLLRLGVTYPALNNAEGTVASDWWGAGWSTETEGYWLASAPLSESNDLEGFPWPDPSRPDLLDDAKAAITKFGDEWFTVPNFGICLFERAWSLRGFEKLLTDFADAPEWVEELLERITEIQSTLVRRFLDLGVDAGYFGDDYGAQRAMLFSPRLWRRIFKPRLARLIAPFREAGLPVIFHSDGDIRAILPDMVEIGVTVLNPVQPEVLEHTWLQREFGAHLSFYGGISTQSVLPSGTPPEVTGATLACMRNLAPNGTGLLLGPSHRMQTDIPPENVATMLDAFSRQSVRAE